jgi:cytochrome oxidase Cu insertion factor (SCO1/SenC/PrrC family)
MVHGEAKKEIPESFMEKAEKNPQTLWRKLRDPWLLLIAMCTIVALIAGVVTTRLLISMRNAPAVQNAGQSTGPGTALNEPAPGFTLRDQQGHTTSLDQFRGKVVVLTFIDPECTQLCPLTTRSMVDALQILGPAAAAHVQLLGIDANPLKTKVSDVADYTRTHELEGRWRFLTGSRAQLESVWKDYHVFVAVKNNDIEHTAVVFLIDGKGNERDVQSTPMSYEAVGDDAQALAAGIARLLPGHPAVAAPDQAAEQPDQPPGGITTVKLTSLGPKPEQVVLGSAHPHLLLFFAGWLGQGPELNKDLAALDSYAAVAEERGWPSPVAVDILTTEPSVAEAQKALTPLAAKLQTPIVEDASGGLADDYHVDDLPWFVLNSASGDILWSHDGWLSGTDVERQVSAALAKKPKQ